MDEEFYDCQETGEPSFYWSGEHHQPEEWKPLGGENLSFEENLPYPFWNQTAP